MKLVAEIIGGVIFFSLPIIMWYVHWKLPGEVYKIHKKYNVTDEYLSIYYPYYSQLDGITKGTTNEALKRELVAKERLASGGRKLYRTLIGAYDFNIYV